MLRTSMVTGAVFLFLLSKSFAEVNQEGCIDVVEWVDSEGRNCSTLEATNAGSSSNGTCSGRSEYIFKGRSQYAACCYCNISSGLSNENDANLLVETSPEDQQCFDTLKWESFDNITCSSINDSMNCSMTGHYEDLLTCETANDSCCACGGGYRGTMIGKTLRVSYPGDSDKPYYLYTDFDNNGKKMGAMPSFLHDVLKSLGGGMYPVKNNSPYSQHISGSSYSQCLDDLNYGNVDLCIGPFWASHSRGNKGNATDAVATDDFYIVSPVTQVPYIETIFSVGMPFSQYAWFGILAMLFLIGISLNIVSKRDNQQEDGCVSNPLKLLSKSLHICFLSLRSFVSGDAVNGSEEPTKAEKIIVIGLVVFSVLIITAYTANAAAFLVMENSPVQYETLADVLSDTDATVCTWSAAVEDIVMNYPELERQIVAVSFSTIDLLDAVIRSDCNVALVPYGDYEVAVTNDESLCKETRLITDGSFIVSIEVVIYMSPFLQSFLDFDLIAEINKFISNGIFIEKYFNPLYFESKEFKFDLSQKSGDIDGRRRQLKNTATISSSSSSSSSLSFEKSVDLSFCPDHAKDDDEEVSLTLPELSFPLSFTFICCMIGISTFFISRWRERSQLKRDFQYLTEIHDEKNNGIVGSITRKMATEREIKALRYHYSPMKAKVLVKELQAHGVDKEDLDDALDILPDKSRLLNLLIEQKQSRTSKEFRLLWSLRISELNDIINKYHNKNDGDDSVALFFDDLISSCDPRNELVETIMSNEKLKRVALLLADRKLIQDEEKDESTDLNSWSKCTALKSGTSEDVSEGLVHTPIVDSKGLVSMLPSFIDSMDKKSN